MTKNSTWQFEFSRCGNPVWQCWDICKLSTDIVLIKCLIGMMCTGTAGYIVSIDIMYLYCAIPCYWRYAQYPKYWNDIFLCVPRSRGAFLVLEVRTGRLGCVLNHTLCRRHTPATSRQKLRRTTNPGISSRWQYYWGSGQVSYQSPSWWERKCGDSCVWDVGTYLSDAEAFVKRTRVSQSVMLYKFIQIIPRKHAFRASYLILRDPVTVQINHSDTDLIRLRRPPKASAFALCTSIGCISLLAYNLYMFSVTEWTIASIA